MVGLRDADCLEFHYDYYDAKRADFEKFRDNPKYCAIMIGAIPHKCESTGDYSSVLAMLNHEEGFPTIIELRDSTGKLKLSTSSLQNGLRFLWGKGIEP